MTKAPPITNRVRALREAHGDMSQAALGEAIGVTRHTIIATGGGIITQPVNRPLLRSTYGEVLAAIEAQLEVSRFLFGGRPSIGDIGLFGQLSQCAIDPSASAIMRRDAVRTFQWVQDLDDASGIEGEWRDPASPMGPGLEGLLVLIGEVFLPYMVANAAAVRSGAPKVSVTLRGMPFLARTASYRSDCLGWLRLALADALAAGAGDLESTLRRHGCWDALQLEPGERETIPPLSPEFTGRRSAIF
jgi:hypothetical protein